MIEQLQSRLQQALSREDYEAASRIKLEIERLKGQEESLTSMDEVVADYKKHKDEKQKAEEQERAAAQRIADMFHAEFEVMLINELECIEKRPIKPYDMVRWLGVASVPFEGTNLYFWRKEHICTVNFKTPKPTITFHHGEDQGGAHSPDQDQVPPSPEGRPDVEGQPPTGEA